MIKQTIISLTAAVGLIMTAMTGPVSAGSYRIVSMATGYYVYNANGAVVASINRYGTYYAGGYYPVINDPQNLLHITYNANMQIQSVDID